MIQTENYSKNVEYENKENLNTQHEAKLCVKCLYDKISTTVESNHKENVSNLLLNSSKVDVLRQKDLTSTKSSNSERSKPSVVTKILLQKLKFLEIQDLIDHQLEKTIPPNKPRIVDSFIAFSNAINLESSKSCIKSFDINIFFNIFTSEIEKSYVLDKFIEKFIADPLAYEKSEKITCLYISIFIYIYQKQRDVDCKLIKKKIEDIEYLYKPNTVFDLFFIKNIFIDKFILNMKKITFDLNEAIFLNHFYLLKSKDKNILEGFHKRLIDCIKNIPSELLFSFLRYVFTHSTVLFTCLTKENLINLIISFYKNTLKTDQVVCFLENLLEKVEDLKIHEKILDELVGICSQSIKYKKLFYKSKILQFRFINEFKDFFNSNSDSFDAISMGFDFLVQIKENSNQKSKSTFEFIEIIIYLFELLKPEFIQNLISKINSFLIELIGEIEEFDVKFLEFNRAHWGSLSKIVLASHRIGIEKCEGTKKKKGSGEIKQSQISKQALKLVEIITKIENLAVSKGLSEITTLKKRGFKLI